MFEAQEELCVTGPIQCDPDFRRARRGRPHVRVQIAAAAVFGEEGVRSVSKLPAGSLSQATRVRERFRTARAGDWGSALSV